MQFALGLLIFLPFLTVIISIHELAHFGVARHYGMKVTEYFIGFGPRIWSTRRGELEWGVKALPIGGYVKIAGMNPYEEIAPEDVDRTYGAKPAYQRALTIFAGPGSHFVVAAILFSLTFFFFGNFRSTVPVVGRVEPSLNGSTSPAADAGMQPGDVIVGIGDVRDPTQEQMRDLVTAAVKNDPGSPVAVTVERDGQEIVLEIVPELDTIEGVKMGRVGIVLGTERIGLVPSVVAGVKEVGFAIEESIGQVGRVFGPQGIGRIVTLLTSDAPRDQQDATSVVGISQQVGATSSRGDWGTVLYFFAFVTVFIGLINLVPLPPFDGGHLAVVAYEKVMHRAVDMRKLIPVSAAVIAFFVIFVSATMFLDFAKPIPTP
ncbi:MAG TPA: RIP metalloprotease [Actinomycetota bacterium]|jgi:membrane-associated protease RseP (regulator of RpoE activity)